MGDEVDLVLAQWRVERPDVDTSPVAVLGRVARLARLVDREVKEFLARFDLEPGEFEVLTTLRRTGSVHGLTAGAFLNSALVTAGAITNRIDRMAAKGLVVRVPDAADRRVVRVRLTDAGRELVDSMLAEHMARHAKLLEPLDAPTRAVVADALRTLLERCE
ncbi:MarR family winged helix-turn-helix transcriptional regulator [Saccharothrix algeriensis]|uniref:MarR family transcriptional regulator n=1 Tax=Saccharothrix algeriensis TaxID=173560 RepID=A0A8T8HYB4_9PSEU|nr:MarR family transcriptional regulator [Saccharothrix algeriensis]MBM7809158.1 DNA-binding MarR family transcriptional regulator [Saccharothrix algeriensis]QTR03522.1 MarR family transcriptional regulator [Saccharothrix algeriensis]